MDGKLNIAILQYDIVWENPSTNRSKIDHFLSEVPSNLDLIVLPEMFTTGFSMNTKEIYETMDGLTIAWMKKKAKEHNAVVTGSIIIKEEGDYFNRLLWVVPDGGVQIYDKKHLFTLAKEHNYFKSGRKKNVFNLRASDQSIWKISPFICYDLRFPVWSRNVEGYDVLIYVANFPEKRRHAWNQLLIARAIENQSYTIGLNRIGKDGMNIPYSGDSKVIDYEGNIILDCGSKEGIFLHSLDKKSQNVFKRAYDFLADRDDFKIEP